jgi:hypothetical protein
MARPEGPVGGRWRVVALTSVATISLGAAACLGSVDRNYDDGETGTDAVAEASAADDVTTAESAADGGGGADVTVVETGPSEAGNLDAPPEAQSGQVYACPGQSQPVTSCAGCGNNTVECVFCGQDGGHPGVCGAKGSYCTSSTPPNSAVCNCAGLNPSFCVAPNQVCNMIGPGDYCQACGEMGSDGRPCKGGGKCSESTGICS